MPKVVHRGVARMVATGRWLRRQTADDGDLDLEGEEER
jgi:hypothetical protein